MEVIENCWDDISADHAIYGTHSWDGSILSVYVASGLSVWTKELQKKINVNDEFECRNCELIFYDVESFIWRETSYSYGPNGDVIWGEPSTEEVYQESKADALGFYLDGTSVEGGMSIWAEIKAERFALKLL